jgi:hypothetical protein
MSTGKSLTKSEVSFHPPVDHVDPGFAVKGFKLRWVNGQVESRRAGRIWSTVKLSQFSKDVQDKIVEANPRWVDGDTIRRRGDLLAMAPLALVNERREELKQAQNANEAIFRGGSNVGDAVSTMQGSSIRDEVLKADRGSDDFR